MSWNPFVLYRGIGVSCLSIAPITAIQFGINGVLGSALQRQSVSPNLSTVERIVVAGTAGFMSALVGGPAELVMTVQQRTGWGFVESIDKLVKAQGFSALHRAIELTAVRDMVWSASYLALGPVVSSCLHDRFPSVFGSSAPSSSMQQRAMASFAGSIVAGLVTVFLTQPIDTIKTVMQGQLADNARSLPNFSVVARDLWAKEGLRYFYRGTTARGLRLVGAVFILGQAKTAYETQLMRYDILG